MVCAVWVLIPVLESHRNCLGVNSNHFFWDVLGAGFSSRRKVNGLESGPNRAGGVPESVQATEPQRPNHGL